MAFRAYYDAVGVGIYKWTGAFDTVVDYRTELLDAEGYCDYFISISMSGENVAFLGGSEYGARGIYVDYNGSLLKVIEVGDVLNGWPVAALSLGPGAFSGNQIAFQAHLNGRRGIYLATIPEPGTLTLLTLGLACLALRRRSPRAER